MMSLAGHRLERLMAQSSDTVERTLHTEEGRDLHKSKTNQSKRLCVHLQAYTYLVSCIHLSSLGVRESIHLARQMAQLVKVPAAKPDDPSSIPRVHMWKGRTDWGTLTSICT